MGLGLGCSIASMFMFKQSELMVINCCWCQWQLLLPPLLGALALRQGAMQRWKVQPSCVAVIWA